MDFLLHFPFGVLPLDEAAHDVVETEVAMKDARDVMEPTMN